MKINEKKQIYHRERAGAVVRDKQSVVLELIISGRENRSVEIRRFGNVEPSQRRDQRKDGRVEKMKDGVILSKLVRED